MAKRPNDDLFEASTMSFGEHLEELRTTLVRALIGLMIGFGIGLLFANRTVKVIEGPLKKALGAYYEDKAKDELIEKYGAEEMEAPPEMLQMIQEHGLVPEFIRMEPGGVIEILKLSDPERFANLQFIEHRFFASDIKRDLSKRTDPDSDPRQFAELCKRLQAAGASDKNPAGAVMWKALSDKQRERVAELSAVAEANDIEQKEIIAILNDLVGKRELHASGEFAQVTVQNPFAFAWWNPLSWREDDTAIFARQRTIDNMRQQLSEEHDPDMSRRLNKLLIAEIFPDQIRRPEKKFVEVPVWKPTAARIIALGAHEVFMIWLKAGFVSGLVIASPWIFWQIWIFVGAGLYPHEKKYVHVFLPISLLLFLSGVALAFLFVFEPVLAFLFSFNKVMEIDPDPRISEWLGFVLFLPLGFGVAFQLPLVMLFINRLGLVTEEMFVKNWRIAILIIFVISMLLTPADPISMLLMAVPLTGLYFLGIGMCRWMPQFRNPFSEEALDPV